MLARRLPSLLILLAVAAADPFAADVNRGRRLTDAAAVQLEHALALHPDDATARAQLLGYFVDRSAAYPQRRLPQVLWLIRHRPADPLTPTLDLISPAADPAGYADASAAWDRAVAADPKATANAAMFFDNGTDTAKAQELLRLAMAAHPTSAEWPALLARSLERQADRDPSAAADLGGQALQLRQDAYKLAPTRTDRFHLLIGQPTDAMATGDVIAARRTATRLLETADGFADDPRHDEAVHQSHTVLGLVALKAGDADKAAEQLADSAKVKALPADGPDLSLARALVAHGDRSIVRDYLRACGPLWPGGRERLRAWVATLDGGGNPNLK